MIELKTGMVLKFSNKPKILGIVLNDNVLYVNYEEVSYSTIPRWYVSEWDKLETEKECISEVYNYKNWDNSTVINSTILTRIYNDKKVKPVWVADANQH